MLSIIVLSKNRDDLLKRLVSSIEMNHKSEPNLLESLIIVENGADAVLSATKDFLKNLNIPIQILSLEKPMRLSAARNKAIQMTQSEWILFLDDDVYLPLDYLRKWKEYVHCTADLDAFGGPNLTPPKSNTFQKLSGLVLSLYVASFSSSKRYHSHGNIPSSSDETELILCNLSIKRKLLNELQFDEKLTGGEENYLLYQLKSKKAYLEYHPHLVVYHERRDHFLTFIKQIYTYGFGRGENIKRGNYRWFHLFPSIGVMFFIGLLVIDPKLALDLFIAYWLCLIIISFNEIKKRKESLRFAQYFKINLLIFLTHLFYSIGVIFGFLRRR